MRDAHIYEYTISEQHNSNSSQYIRVYDNEDVKNGFLFAALALGHLGIQPVSAWSTNRFYFI
jgi:hypothetical protein